MCNRARSTYRLAVPLVPADGFRGERTRLDPWFESAGQQFARLPLELASVPLIVFGKVQASPCGDSDRLRAALDLALARI